MSFAFHIDGCMSHPSLSWSLIHHPHPGTLTKTLAHRSSIELSTTQRKDATRPATAAAAATTVAMTVVTAVSNAVGEGAAAQATATAVVMTAAPAMIRATRAATKR